MTSLSVDIALPGIEVAFDVPPGVTVLFGPSGAGKSRTLGCIAGIIRPDRGRISLGEARWLDSERGTSLPIHERRVAYLFQSLALFPHMTAAENVAYGIPRNVPREARRGRALEMLAKMRVRDLAERKPRTFSGGEAQRVALARAFAMDPAVILLDEPFSALDVRLRLALLEEIREQLEALKIPTVLVTHQPSEAQVLGDRVVFIEQGRITRMISSADRPWIFEPA
jgi:molybdate transport system ATP-binding protein